MRDTATVAATAARMLPAWVPAVAIGMGALAGPSGAAETYPERVRADYRVQLAGVKFGNYTFNAVREDGTYRVRSSAKLEALFGAFRWRGEARVRGDVRRNRPRPATYRYDYRRNKKAPRQTTVRFEGRDAIEVTRKPVRRVKKNRVPVTAEHRLGVLDPMSALVQLSIPRQGGHPCKRKVQVFDGNHRFDVELRPGRRTKLALGTMRGFNRNAWVCRIRFTPIAGHRKDGSSYKVADMQKMTVTLVASRDGSVLVPFRIAIPTVIGDAVVEATSVNVRLSNAAKLALGG